jgi:hypothetical protein
VELANDAGERVRCEEIRTRDLYRVKGSLPIDPSYHARGCGLNLGVGDDIGSKQLNDQSYRYFNVFWREGWRLAIKQSERGF